MNRFLNRREAGWVLATRLTEYATRSDVFVLGLPRGGIPVAYEVARALKAPLDVFTVRKIGLPWHEELAVGALASGDVRFFDRAAMEHFGITEEALAPVVAREKHELERRERLYRGGVPFPELHDKTVILVDDGLATGATMLAAIEALRRHRPVAIVVATPVASREACARIGTVAKCVCVAKPEPFYGVGAWYDDFEQTTDADVLALVHDAAARYQAKEGVVYA